MLKRAEHQADNWASPFLSPIVTQTGPHWLRFASTGSLHVAFLHRKWHTVSGPRASLYTILYSSLCLFGLQFRLTDLLLSLALICNLQVDGSLGCWQLGE